jgi:hypothetical protein
MNGKAAGGPVSGCSSASCGIGRRVFSTVQVDRALAECQAAGNA